MNKLVTCFILIFCPLICLADDIHSGDVSDSIDYYNPDNILKFADYLYDNEDYLRAAGEYQRYLFMAPRAGNSDSLYYHMIKSVFLGKDYKKCLTLLDTFGRNYRSSTKVKDIDLYKSIITYHLKNYRESLSLVGRQDYSDPIMTRIIIAMDYLSLGDLEKARENTCSSAIDRQQMEIADFKQSSVDNLNYLCDQISSFDTLTIKNKLRAGLYSAFVPGLGKAYCGRSADGVYSLILIGLASWLAYDGFADDKEKSVKGWTFGILGTGFYIGNIYGSVIAAELYNKRIYDDFMRGLNIEISLP